VTIGGRADLSRLLDALDALDVLGAGDAVGA
jgi:hypothetical protein